MDGMTRFVGLAPGRTKPLTGRYPLSLLLVDEFDLLLLWFLPMRGSVGAVLMPLEWAGAVSEEEPGYLWEERDVRGAPLLL